MFSVKGRQKLQKIRNCKLIYERRIYLMNCLYNFELINKSHYTFKKQQKTWQTELMGSW